MTTSTPYPYPVTPRNTGQKPRRTAPSCSPEHLADIDADAGNSKIILRTVVEVVLHRLAFQRGLSMWLELAAWPRTVPSAGARDRTVPPSYLQGEEVQMLPLASICFWTLFDKWLRGTIPIGQ